MVDFLEFRKPLARCLLPFTKGCYLRLSHGRPRDRLPIFTALHESLNKLSARRLARAGRCKKDLLQHGVSFEGRICEVLGDARLVEMHDVLTAPGRCPNENYSSKAQRSLERHLLGDHAP